jgi:putative Ca2+/H+ antiporter (TMEM165/GDT1 family)
LDTFLISLGLVFVAELGDKSQLMAMTLAARYRPATIMVAIAAGAAVVHGLSVTLGAAIGEVVPGGAIAVSSGVAFLGFAAWTALGDRDGDDGRSGPAPRTTVALLWSVALTFVLSELGDKTMLAAATLATNRPALATWAGSTLGMIAADGLAIVVGGQLGARLPERVIRLAAASIFAAFGLVLIAGGLR